jgi:hypothetical protein
MMKKMNGRETGGLSENKRMAPFAHWLGHNSFISYITKWLRLQCFMNLRGSINYTVSIFAMLIMLTNLIITAHSKTGSTLGQSMLKIG